MRARYAYSVAVADDVERLSAVALFAPLSEEEREAALARARAINLDVGEPLFEEGGEPTEFFAVLEGAVQPRYPHGHDEDIRIQAPTYMATMSVMTDKPYTASMFAIERSRALAFPRELLFEMIDAHPALRALVSQAMMDTTRTIEAAQRMREKLMSLGSLAAGLAHELNNPAAAARRAAAELDAADDAGVQAAAELGQITPELLRLREEVLLVAGSCDRPSALELADREDELADALDDVGADPRLAGALAEAGLGPDIIERAGSPAAVAWIAAAVDAASLRATVLDATERIAGLVKAIKEYTYLDKGGLHAVNVRDGIEKTLKILGHKLRDRNVAIEREFADHLPAVAAFGPELNQVWTNIIDNAAQAAPGGTITVRTRHAHNCVEVTIDDTGPGVPEEMRDRIFEPFFTTKDPGSGTGLGLDVAYRIVTQRHAGSLRVEEAPGGGARFIVSLPVDKTKRD